MISNIRPFIRIIDSNISSKLVRALGKALNKIENNDDDDDDDDDDECFCGMVDR